MRPKLGFSFGGGGGCCGGGLATGFNELVLLVLVFVDVRGDVAPTGCSVTDPAAAFVAPRQLCMTSTFANAINPTANGMISVGSGSMREVSHRMCSFANAAWAGMAVSASMLSILAGSMGAGVASPAACLIVSERRRKMGIWIKAGSRPVASG